MFRVRADLVQIAFLLFIIASLSYFPVNSVFLRGEKPGRSRSVRSGAPCVRLQAGTLPTADQPQPEEAVCRDVGGHQMDVSDGTTFAAGQNFTVSLH